MKEKIIAGIGFGLGLLGLCLGIKAGCDTRKMADKVGLSVEALSHASNIDIESAMIENAVRHAVDREAGRAVSLAVKTVVSDTQKEIRKDVADGVKQIYPDLKSSLVKEVTRQIGDLDISDIREEALEKAKEAAAEKLSDSMDDILEKFNGDLKNVSKIYNSIATMMNSNNNSKEMTFRIG